MPMWIEIYIYINIFIIGTLFGSFFTLATYRIPRKQDIVFKTSYCPNCKHELKFWDLIPVLSYIFIGGKCRYCSEKISVRYPLFELSNGVIFVILYMMFGLSIYFFVALAVYIYLFLLTGCYVMNTKMIKEEIINIKKVDEKNKKSGVFILEILIAAILFAVFVTTSFITSRNYLGKSMDTIARNNAIIECTKNIELALATEYDNLNSFSDTVTLENITYNTNVSVYKYSEEFPNKKDYIKKINAKVEYMLNGQNLEYEINTLKKKVID